MAQRIRSARPLLSLLRAIDNLPWIHWEQLPPSMQNWSNAAARAVKAGQSIPALPGAQQSIPALPGAHGATTATPDDEPEFDWESLLC